jgi:membrane associated rhomboid family serine protease
MARYGGDDFGPSPQIAMPRLTPTVRAMLIALGVSLVISLVLFHYVPKGESYLQSLWLFPNLTIKKVQLWRTITYPLVNLDIMATAWAGLTLYFFGTDLEELFGGGRFLVFTFLCVLFAGIVSTLYGLVHSVFFTQPVFGVPALSLAVTAAWGTRFPHRRLFFPPVSGKWLVIGLLGFEILFMLAKQWNPSAIASIAIGWALAKYWDRIDDMLDRMRIRRARAKRDRVLRAIRGGLDAGPSSKKKPIDKRFLN